MKASQTTIVSCVLLFVAALAFYMLLISPKRSEVSELNDEVSSLESSIAEQDQVISFGQQARREFPRDYGRLVVLGKAVPDQADTASLLVQLNSFAGDAGVDFRGITLSADSAGSGTATAAVAPTTPPATGTETTGTTSTESGSTTTTTAAPVPATEASAATLPIGATVGTAGLATLPYNLDFNGGFFDIAAYMGKVDSLVGFKQGDQVEVDGRLMTVDGFSMIGGNPSADPVLKVQMMVTSYVTPSTQGLTAGATPTGPSVAGVPSATPASTTVTP